jgi:hypothetical protein
MIAHNAESARGIAPRAAHRSGLEPLDSSGSRRQVLKFRTRARDRVTPPDAPDTTWPVSRFPPCLFPEKRGRSGFDVIC